MAIGVFGFLVLLAVLAGIALPIVALVDLVRRPAATWALAGHNQLVWALIIVFVGFVGPILYLLIARPALDVAEARREATAGPA
ncbi:MAG: PLDc N-terminal domain-containing protein [Acidimicrobiia bacterium]